MNFPAPISPATTSFAEARNSPGCGCSRVSERKTNFAIAMSAAASIPCPVTSPSTTASRPSGAPRKSNTSPPTSTRADDSYTVSDLETRQIRLAPLGASDRCIVSAKLFCCWYRRALSMARAACPAIDNATSTTSPRRGRAGSSDTSVSVASASAGVATGMTTAVPPRSRKGTSSSCPAARPPTRRSSTIGSPERNKRADAASRDPLGPRQDRSEGLELGIRHVHRRGSSTSPRASGSRITAASIPSVSTTVLVTASRSPGVKGSA